MNELMLVLLALLLPVGALCGIIALARIRDLTRRIDRLEQRLQSAGGREAATGAASTPALARAQPDAADATPAGDVAIAGRGPTTASAATDTVAPGSGRTAHIRMLREHLREHWMIWLGGFCVAMAGVYLAKYSIERGLLGPGARVLMGLLTGAALHLAAEWLRRRTGAPHPAFAALAGGGSITLFAVLLASMRLYDLLSPTTTFALLGAVALLTLWLAYRQGPALAAIGIVGAYLVPALVSSGQGRILVALGYTLLVSASALLLMRYVYRSWLWWGFVAGSLGWWLISLNHGSADPYRGYYLTALGYMALSIPTFDWLLRQGVALPSERMHRAMYHAVEPQRERLGSILCVLLILAQCVSMQAVDAPGAAFWLWTPLAILLLLAARHRENLNFAPTLLLLSTCAAWLLSRWRYDGLHTFAAPENHQFLIYLAGTGLLYVLLALRNFASCRFAGIWSSLAVLAPLLLMSLGYLLTAQGPVSWSWGFAALLVGLCYLGLAGAALRKASAASLVLWLFFGGHFALSLAAVAVLEEARLTLAIAAQAISAAWIIDRFRVPQLGWVLKIIVAGVLIRLTLNPWLATYPPEQHWSLWAYGGATLCTAIATWLLRRHPSLARWSEGATLHLFVLTCWAELRYWLHDGQLFTASLSFMECATYVSLFGSLAVVYYRRSLASEHLAGLYRGYAYALSLLGLGAYGLLLLNVAISEPWVTSAIGSRPLLNATQLAFGAPVLVGLAHWLFYEQRFRRMALAFSGLAAWVYSSLQVRHLFQGTVSLLPPTSNGELYSYSALWLVMAFATILAGAWRLGSGAYRAGLLLLALVIAKLFLVDMSDLEGLYRVASFMGLGLALLGLSFLHQRIQQMQRDAS